MPTKQTVVDMLLILLLGIALFGRVSTAYFCGFDDFGETHRAVFEDIPHPQAIFTTAHFGSTKYRPLNRLSTYICWIIGDGGAWPFRLRNLLFHLLCALLVYALAWEFTQDRQICLAASALFCVMPAANQTVVAAIFTNTTAYAFLLGGFLVFLYWLRLGRQTLLAASMTLILIALFFYEPAIVVFGMMFGYVLMLSPIVHSQLRNRMVKLAASSAAVLLAFTVVRHLVVRGASPRVPMGTMLQNTAMYCVGLVSPVDPVLGNYLVGAGLPPHIRLDERTWWSLAFSLLMLTLAVVAIARTSVVRAGYARLNKGLALFLLFCCFAALLPFLVFTPHASETYLYLPAAMYVILLSLVLRAFLRSAVYITVIAILLVLFGASTWVRNQKVADCGDISRRILSELPVKDWKTGEEQILLANAPGEASNHYYGIYLYRGLATIERGEPGDSPAAMYALQLATNNPELKVKIVDVQEMKNSCTLPRSCFWVHSDGTVQEFYPNSMN
jgi:hypothetical protein